MARCSGTFLPECRYVTCDVAEVWNKESYKIVITLECLFRDALNFYKF